MKNLLLSVVNTGDLRRLNYNRFRPGLSPTAQAPLWVNSRRSLIPQSEGRGYLPHFPPLVSGPKGALFSFRIGTPTFRPKLRPYVGLFYGLRAKTFRSRAVKVRLSRLQVYSTRS